MAVYVLTHTVTKSNDDVLKVVYLRNFRERTGRMRCRRTRGGYEACGASAGGARAACGRAGGARAACGRPGAARGRGRAAPRPHHEQPDEPDVPSAPGPGLGSGRAGGEVRGTTLPGPTHSRYLTTLRTVLPEHSVNIASLYLATKTNERNQIEEISCVKVQIK